MAGQNSVLYPAIGTLIDSLLVWALFGGIGEYVTGRGPAEIALRALRLRVSFAVLATLALLSRIALPESSGLHDVAILIGLIAWIVWLVLSLRLVHRVRTEIAPSDKMARKDARRPWQFSLRTLLLMPLVLWLLLLACFPKLTTGDFCDVRVEKVSVREDGLIELDYSTRTSSGTHELEEESGGGRGSNGGYEAGFPAWPVHGSLGSAFYLNPDVRDRAPRKSAITSWWSREEPTG